MLDTKPKLDMRHQFIPSIDVGEFKKILTNLHKKLSKSEIKLSAFKDQVVELWGSDILGFKNLSHLVNYIAAVKKDPHYEPFLEKMNEVSSNGGYLLYGHAPKIAELLGTRTDLVLTVLDQLIVRFSKKKPYLVVDWKVCPQAKFSQILKKIKGSSNQSLILLCMANSAEDAFACYSSLCCEPEPLELNVLFANGNGGIDNSLQTHLLPHNAISPVFAAIPSEIELLQLKRPDLALSYWAEKNNDLHLQELLELAKSNDRFRCRVYFDELNHNIKLRGVPIKAKRASSTEVRCPERVGVEPLPSLLERELGIKIDSKAGIVNYAEDIIKFTDVARKHFNQKYEESAIYIISNGVMFLSELNPEMVVPLDEAVLAESCRELTDAICKVFGIEGALDMMEMLINRSQQAKELKERQKPN
jgi:hypothetical protein